MELSQEEQEALKQARLVREMVTTEGFREIFKPWLEDKIAHSWVDPREAKDKEDFERRYNLAWAMAQSADQILKFVDDKIAHAEYLEKKERGEINDNFDLGEE